jgi:flagellar hook-associated protein 2
VNSSGIGVTASYDSLTDKVTFSNTNPTDTSIINFGAVDDTSNFLDVIGVDGAYQYTNGSGSTEVASSVGLGNIDQNITLDSQNYGVGVMTGGSFKINGITITVDPAVDGLSDVIERINASNAGVTVSYDSNTDGLRVVSDNLGSRTISFTSGTSNFLDVMNLTSATQVAGTDSQFTIDGGPVLTRNSNEISDVIGGVTISMKSIGSSTITVNQDVDAGIAVVQEFVDGFNNSIQNIADAIAETGNLKGDFSIRSIKNELQTLLYQSISGAAEDRNNILDIGISSGSSFDSTAVFKIEIDDEVLREAFAQGATSIENIFVNDAETGIGDLMFSYLDTITDTFGFLNDRSKANGSIDLQIQSLRDRIDSSEERLVIKEQRLRSSFIRMEQLSSQYQSQASSFNNFAAGF